MEVMLSTERWGHDVDQANAFALLDRFVELGGEYVTTTVATSHTGRPEDFAGAIRMLKKWLRTRREASLKIWCTIRALDNSVSPRGTISASAILTEVELIRGRTFEHLHGIILDCGDEASEIEWSDCLGSLRYLRSTGLNVGLTQQTDERFASLLKQNSKRPWFVNLKLDADAEVAVKRIKRLLPQSEIILCARTAAEAKFDDLPSGVKSAVFGIQVPTKTISELESAMVSHSRFSTVEPASKTAATKAEPRAGL